MSPTRRQAAIGLMAGAAASLPIFRAQAQPAPAVREIAPAVDDEPNTAIDTGHDRYEHMLAPVGINGQGPFRFLMDTGANVSCISRRLADKLALEAGPPAQVHTVVGVQTHPSVMIERLQVGARNRKDVRAPALPISGVEVDGVLGVDWLKGQRLVLGFKQKSLEITKSRSETSVEGRIVVPARRKMGQLTIVDADLSGKRISAMIDSGSQVTICNGALRQLVVEAEMRKGRLEQHSRVRLESLAGEPFGGEMLYIPFVRLGGLHLGNVPVVYADMHVFELWGLKDVPALVLGMDLLTQFTSVVLDFGRSQVRFDVDLKV